MGLLDPSTSDGRVIFFLPWRGITIAGTTDAPTGLTAMPFAREHDIQFILQEIRSYLSSELSGKQSNVSKGSLNHLRIAKFRSEFHSEGVPMCYVCSDA